MSARVRAHVLVVVVGLASASCMSASGGDDATPTPPPNEDGYGGVLQDVGLLHADASDADAPTTCAAPTKLDPVLAQADTIIVHGAGECGVISYGTSPYLNCGAGVALLRFPLDARMLDAFAHGKVASLSVDLARATDCSGPCPQQAGTIVATPLRNDWSEGTGGVGPDRLADGATWCTRADEKAWGSNGAAKVGEDRAATNATTKADATSAKLSIDLPASAFAGSWIDTASGTLSVVLEAKDGAVLTFQSRESLTPPTLQMSVCP